MGKDTIPSALSFVKVFQAETTSPRQLQWPRLDFDDVFKILTSTFGKFIISEKQSQKLTIAVKNMAQQSPTFVEELTFLTQYTNEDETTILTQALNVGLNYLYRQAIEQAFIDEQLPRPEAVAILGQERVEEIEYARQALAEDIARGLAL